MLTMAKLLTNLCIDYFALGINSPRGCSHCDKLLSCCWMNAHLQVPRSNKIKTILLQSPRIVYLSSKEHMPQEAQEAANSET